MKYSIENINNEEVYTEFESKDIIEQLLILPENNMFLFQRNKENNETLKMNEFSNSKYLPDIGNVILSLGYDIHSFGEMMDIYNEIFENDDNYLPFDNNELYITKDDIYQGCCDRNAYEFMTKKFHYFFGIVNNNENK